MKKKVFCEGDWELLYDSRFKRDFKGKLRTRWLGPYQIDRVFDNGTVCLVTIDENHTPLFSIGHRLRLYHTPISRDAFISQVAANLGYQLAQGQESFSALVSLQKVTVISTQNKFLYINKLMFCCFHFFLSCFPLRLFPYYKRTSQHNLNNLNKVKQGFQGF